jgi:hypothetical protein
MSARIVELSRVAAARAAAVSGVDLTALGEAEGHEFRFWTGSSGQRYVHSVFSLIGCPELPSAVYMLMHTDANGVRTLLRVGRTEHDAPSLNLAEIRHRGAQLGANEVHVHFLASSERQRRLIELDLRSAHFSELGSEVHPSLQH